ncbi:unnamed protein product, partial [Vitis vinifera]
MMLLARAKASTLTKLSFLLPSPLEVSERLVTQTPVKERLLPFWLKLRMKPQVVGQLLRMAHMHGDTASFRNKETLETTVLPINNGHALLGKNTTAGVPSKFHTTTTTVQQEEPLTTIS